MSESAGEDQGPFLQCSVVCEDVGKGLTSGGLSSLYDTCMMNSPALMFSFLYSLSFTSIFVEDNG